MRHSLAKPRKEDRSTLPTIHCPVASAPRAIPCSGIRACYVLWSGVMATRSGSGGTTHVPNFSTEPSEEDIEVAQHLNSLNHAQDHHTAGYDLSRQEHQPAGASSDQDSEIYHSLTDAVPLAHGEQPEQPLTPGSTAYMASASGTNAPVTGQVCRYVLMGLLRSTGAYLLSTPSSPLTCSLLTNEKQLRHRQDSVVASLSCWRSYLQCMRFI